MPTPTRHPARWLATLASVPIAVSSVGVTQAQDDPGPSMAVEVSGLESGTVVTDNEIDLSVSPIGYEFSGAHAGTPPVDGIGHYHVVLDGGLINMFTEPEASVSLQNVAPGAHTLMVVPAMNDHMPVSDGAVTLEFDYQPSDPLPEITSSDAAGGTPGISIVSPAPGDTISGEFDVVVETTDFELSESMLGKPNVDGMGHWHLFLDAAEGMSTMMGMSGTDTMAASTEALSPGTHTFIAVLVDNLHAPFDPPVATSIELEVAAPDEADETAAAGSETVAVSLTEFALDPAMLELSAGSFTFEGVNDGTIPHALVIEGEGVRAGTPDPSYPSGTTQSFEVELPPGTYEIYCPVPGHKDAGMTGVVTVTA